MLRFSSFAAREIRTTMLQHCSVVLVWVHVLEMDAAECDKKSHATGTRTKRHLGENANMSETVSLRESYIEDICAAYGELNDE